MQYLETLLEAFSDTPARIVVKADVLRRGVRPTRDLSLAGTRSCTSGLTNRTRDAEGRSARPPGQFHFRTDETTVDIKVSETSPYEIVETPEGLYQLYCGDRELGEVRFEERPAYPELRTSNGQRCGDFLMQRGPHCLLVSPLDFCAYYRKGQACLYCTLSPMMDARLRRRRGASPVPDYEAMAEAVALASEEIELRDLKLSGGALYDTRREAEFYGKCLEAILRRIDPPEEITIFSQAFSKADQKQLKDLGAVNVCFDMEVWNEDLWPKLIPGKSRAVGRREWIRRLEDAVDVFGRGHVGSNFVGGFECAPREGFLSPEAAFRSYREGFESLLQRGVVPWFTIWNAHPLVGGFDVDDPPATDFYLRLGAELHELIEKHGAYRDLGFSGLGIDPPTLGLYCFYCFSMQFTRDYPRLVDRKAPPLEERREVEVV